MEFPDGSVATVHVANPGSMIGLTASGSRVLVSRAANPARKLAWSLELIEADGTLVGINTVHPNRLVADAIGDGTISELAGYGGLRREVAYGKNSRIDILLTGGAAPEATFTIRYMRRDGEVAGEVAGRFAPADRDAPERRYTLLNVSLREWYCR